MIYVPLLLLLGMMCVVAWGIFRLVDSIDRLSVGVERLRVSGRTVQKKAVMRDGALTEERELTRLARSTKGRRIVVGGEEESVLHETLSRGVRGGRRDEAEVDS